MQDNLKAVIRVMQYIYDNIMDAELNTSRITEVLFRYKRSYV